MRRPRSVAIWTFVCGISQNNTHGFSNMPSVLLPSTTLGKIQHHDRVRPSSSSLQLSSSSPTTSGNGEESSTASSSCPFSKHFPKYRIDFTRVPPPKDQGSFSFPFVGDIQKSLQKSQWQNKFPKDIKIQWIGEEDDEEEEGGDLQAITIFERLWRTAADLSSATGKHRVVLGITDTSHLALVQHWKDMFDWTQQEKVLKPLLLGNTQNIDVTIHSNEGGILVVDLVVVSAGDSKDVLLSTISDTKTAYDPVSLTKRTQAWVKRILVDQGICPFTKSVRVSGQGLDDLGIPVAKIHYCSSNAQQTEIYKLMADSWREIAYMLDMGPRGRDGISSILLAAPEYDNNFDLWSGPIFTMLENGVVACGLEKEVGVVCFHPQYATPDGRSFPGFGHMHSVPRLQKWIQQNDPELEEGLTQDEIAAGGAWQRRTPHATINVLRADQLEAAEGRRVTSELYTENIRKLMGKPDGIGSEQLQRDLEREQALR